jgi:uncharacterized protein (DUF2164 family)
VYTARYRGFESRPLRQKEYNSFMSHKNRKLEFVSEEKKNEYLKEIIGFFETERNEEIGVIAAENVLDFFMNTMGEEIYRKAIKDVQKALREKMEDLDVELELLLEK